MRTRLEREFADQQAALGQFAPPLNGAAPSPNSSPPAGVPPDGGRPAAAPAPAPLAPNGPPPAAPQIPPPVPIPTNAGGVSGPLAPLPTITLPGVAPLPTVTLPAVSLTPTRPSLPSGLPTLPATPPGAR